MVIRSHRGPYRVRFGEAFAGLDRGLTDREHLLIDAKVAELYGRALASALAGRSVLRIDATEANKSLERLPDYVTGLIERGIQRTHVLIAVGGGIIQDIAAFIAATLLRGVAWRFYPTTLLAQADSCIGSKSSINIGPYKNQLGTFTPPEEIWISPEVLETLSDTDLRSGIGEMLKVHLIAGWEDTRAIMADYPRLTHDAPLLMRRIRRSLEIKQGKIEADEFDRGERLVMNYGHSFGHAIESATDFMIPHGIAVTIGMDLANYASLRFGWISQSVFNELHTLLVGNYAGFEQASVPEDRFFAALAKDKKNVDCDITLILMRGPGAVFRDRYRFDERLRGLCREYFRVVKGVELCPS
ncbi:MAG: 3-dehydroquinate synthase [Candidatus Omnitrophica bacterium]|nr:3-dehydroquinate synthase [Candidatus Omnitrophota bacterium]